MKHLLKLAALGVALALTGPAWADRVIDADVVVVGAGAGGSPAGVAAVEAGLKTVMLEKLAWPGGSGNFMEGAFAVESFMQKEKGAKLTRLEAFNRMGEYHHWRINAPVVKRFIDKSAETIQWICDHGVKFTEVTSVWPDNPNPTWHIYPGHGSFPSRMIEIFNEKGGQLLLSTPAQKLIMKDGRVAGVVAKNEDGEVITINAGNVILASGGYSHDTEMVKKLTGIDITPVCSPGRTGDGIKMAMEVGAVGDNMGPMMINGAFMPVPGESSCSGPSREIRGLFRQRAALYVDSTGRRFFNEGLALNWTEASNSIARTGSWTYIVFDEDYVRELTTEGRGYPDVCGSFIPKGHVATKLRDLIKEHEAKGNVFIGNTIEEVARKAGMDPATLRKSVDNMNRYARQGRDDQFGKQPEFLRSVTKAPFYIIRGKLESLVSLNGLKINEDFQVLDKDSRPIPGLYATGADAGGLYGDSYDLPVGEGTSSAFAINGARIAVEHIVANRK